MRTLNDQDECAELIKQQSSRQQWRRIYLCYAVLFIVFWALWIWLHFEPNIPASVELSPAVDRCIEDWERFDRPDEWLINCLDRAYRELPN